MQQETVSDEEAWGITLSDALDELENVVRRLDHCRAFLRGVDTGTPTNDLLVTTARDVMSLLQAAGRNKRAPMIERWDAVMPSGWTGPRDFAENLAMDQHRAAARTFTDAEITEEQVRG